MRDSKARKKLGKFQTLTSKSSLLDTRGLDRCRYVDLVSNSHEQYMPFRQMLFHSSQTVTSAVSNSHEQYMPFRLRSNTNWSNTPIVSNSHEQYMPFRQLENASLPAVPLRFQTLTSNTCLLDGEWFPVWSGTTSVSNSHEQYMPFRLRGLYRSRLPHHQFQTLTSNTCLLDTALPDRHRAR